MKNIIGNASVIASLNRAVSSGQISHAYVFAGEKGLGKKTLAHAFAKALGCDYPDVFYVEATKTKSIGVDDVREQINHPIQSKPFKYKYKIFIVDEAETLTVQAQNALLKIIEEPPAYGIFIFLVNGLHTLLPTVLSRCVVHKLKPVSDAEIKKALTLKGLTSDGIEFAQGNIGRAIDMASSESFAAMLSLTEEIFKTIRNADILSAVSFYKRFEEYKDSAGILLNLLALTYAAEARRHKGMKNARETVQCMDAVIRAKKALERNGNFQLVIELMLIELIGGIYDGNRSAV